MSPTLLTLVIYAAVALIVAIEVFYAVPTRASRVVKPD